MLAWYVILGSLTYLMFGLDKRAAVSGRRRTSERFLLIMSAIGGVWGGLMAMVVFRHKICKPSFCMIMGAIVLAHVALLVLR